MTRASYMGGGFRFPRRQSVKLASLPPPQSSRVDSENVPASPWVYGNTPQPKGPKVPKKPSLMPMLSQVDRSHTPRGFALAVCLANYDRL